MFGFIGRQRLDYHDDASGYWQACLLLEGKFTSIYRRVDGYVFWEASSKAIAKVVDGEFNDLRDDCIGVWVWSMQSR